MSNVEFDLEAMMEGEVYADFMLLFLVCHQSRLEILEPAVEQAADKKPAVGKKKAATRKQKQIADEDEETTEEDEAAEAAVEPERRRGPEHCWLEKWATQADQQGTRAREKLRDGVEKAIQALGAGFLTTKGHGPLRDKLRTGKLSTQDYYRQLLRLVYRLLLLLVAEEKKTESGDNLLHPPGTPAEIRQRYARFYSVGRIRNLAFQRRGTPHADLYESLKVLFAKLRTGYAPLGIPGLGSFLFSADSTPDLNAAPLANRDLLDAFWHLCYTEDSSGGGTVRRPVDFGNLGSEELGSVYESLLELHPLRPRRVATCSPANGRFIREISVPSAFIPTHPEREEHHDPMSHIVEIQTQVRDAEAVRAACCRLGLPPPVEGVTQLFSGSVTGLAVQLPGWKYPAVCELTTGQMRYDNYGGAWGAQQELDRFLQAYAAEMVKIEARKQGHTVTEQPLSDGSIRLTIQVTGGAA